MISGNPLSNTTTVTSPARTRSVLSLIIFVVLFAQVLLYPGVDTLVAVLNGGGRINSSMWFLATEFTAFVVFAGIWGGVSDTTGRRKLLVTIGGSGAVIFYGLLAMLPSLINPGFLFWLVLRFFQGAMTIGVFTISMTMLMDLPGGHGKNMGAAGIGIGLGTALGAPVGGQLYTIGPYTPLLAASGLFVLVTLLSVLLVDHAPGRHYGGIMSAISSVQQNPALGIPFSLGYIDRFTAGFFSLVGTLYFREIFELDPAQTGVTLALFFAPFALLQYPFGVLSDRIGRTLPVVVGSLLYGVAVVFVGVVESLVIAQSGMVLVGILGALMAPGTMAIVTDLSEGTERGVAMAGFNVAGSVGFLSGILVGGFTAATYGYLTSFVVAGGLEIVIAILILPLLRGLPID